MSARCLPALLVAAVAGPARADLPPPAELPGPVVVAGGGALPAAAREEFVALAGGPAARVVVIPTASADADDPKAADAFLKPWRDAKPAAVVLLHTRDRKRADDPAFAKPLADATAVWFSGGDQSRLTAAYRGTLVEKELRRLHARGGVVGGTSAGAAALGDVMITGGANPAATAPGLGLLPGFVVDQHLTQRGRLDRLKAAVAAHPGRVGLGVDEGTAAVIRGRVGRVVGGGIAAVVIAEGAGRPAVAQAMSAGDDRFDVVQLRRAAANRAARDPFPPARPADPVVESGSLVVVGGGGAGAEIWKRFLDLAGGPDAPVVVIPTALEDPLPVTPVEVAVLRKYGATNVTVLHTRSRAEADDPKFSAPLLKAKGVWFGGGRQWRFVDAYEGTLTERRVRGVLGRGGVVGGSSAGASIQSEYMPRGHPLGNTVMMAEGYERGFGYLPGAAVDQHFFARKRTADMSALVRTYPQFLGIGIDEGTAIVVTKGVAEVIGRSRVAFYDPRRKPDGDTDYEEVRPGERYDLVKRQKVK